TWIDIKSRWNEDDPSGWDWVNNSKEYIWVSEKDGWRHIYRIDLTGKESLVTKGDYDITSIKLIDNKNGFIYFMASPNNATESYLYKINIDGSSDATLVSPANLKGTHEYDISPNGLIALHTFSNANTYPINQIVGLPKHTIISKAENGKRIS